MFITLEGPDGGGKSTQITLLTVYLRQQGYRVLTTREPGGTLISDQVREVLMNLKNQSMNPRSETLLFCAARAQLVEEVIRPALALGTVVISDRYADSTMAYQGYGHGNDLEFLHKLLDYATGGLWPDLTLLLDIDVAAGLGRRRTSEEWNRMDAYAMAFHQRVRQGYLTMASLQPQRWVVIQAEQSPQQVQSDLRQAVLSRLQLAHLRP